MKSIKLRIVTFAVLTTTLTVVAFAQQGAILDPNSHPLSPKYESLFPDTSIPLDASLSWTNRFNGDETFNDNETLEKYTGASKPSAVPEPENTDLTVSVPGEMDAIGVVQQVKAGQGKVKIKHGPIERLGMPGMTMVFKVVDPSQLAGMERGAEVAFDVDTSSGGFVITHIKPVDK